MITVLVLTILLCILYLIEYTRNTRNTRNKESYTDTSPLITFIIPSIGRPTLPRALQSLMKLSNNKGWRAIVVFDGIPKSENVPELNDPRVQVIELPKKTGTGKNHAGRVRNAAFPHVRTEWVGFLDDDDELEPCYINKLIEHTRAEPALDVLIFRMRYSKDGKVLPPVEHVESNTFYNSYVGISFCMKTALTDRYKFVPSPVEDFLLLDEMRQGGCAMRISPTVGYIVN